jgi:hypothetical protein
MKIRKIASKIVNAAPKKININFSKSTYNSIKDNAIKLFNKVVGKKPTKGFDKKFFSNYDSAVKELEKFYPNTEYIDTGYPYPLITVETDDFHNGPMMEKFGKTHLKLFVNGFKIIAGYLAIGTGGVGLKITRDAYMIDKGV